MNVNTATKITVTDHAWDRLIEMSEFAHITEAVVLEIANDPYALVQVDRDYNTRYRMNKFVHQILPKAPQRKKYLVTGSAYKEFKLVIARAWDGNGFDIVTVMFNSDVVKPGHVAYEYHAARQGW